HRASPALTSWIAYETEPADRQTVDQDRRMYSRGTYGGQIGLRAGELPGDLTPDTDDAYVLALFLLGLYAGRRRIFHDVAAHLPFIRRVQRWGLIIGVAGNAAFAIGGSFAPSPTSGAEKLGPLCLAVAAPALTL